MGNGSIMPKVEFFSEMVNNIVEPYGYDNESSVYTCNVCFHLTFAPIVFIKTLKTRLMILYQCES